MESVDVQLGLPARGGGDALCAQDDSGNLLDLLLVPQHRGLFGIVGEGDDNINILEIGSEF